MATSDEMNHMPARGDKIDVVNLLVSIGHPAIAQIGEKLLKAPLFILCWAIA